jgi:2-polyprenyl-3-methyl-5-hydroxy-6-metoxy-1,4-benzoquinol methylase
MDNCKICGAGALRKRLHTAQCRKCGVLLYYPYPSERELSDSWAQTSEEDYIAWYARSPHLNHENFTRMLRFATDGEDPSARARILDYGCGGGQFALVAKSHFPQSEVYSVDAVDAALINEWRPIQKQIPFGAFQTDANTFDYIFLNDVFEHLQEPIEVLRLLTSKLSAGGKMFIDTPKSFWLYPAARVLSSTVYANLLRGTVSLAHLQIWSKKSLFFSAAAAGLKVDKYRELTEFTMPANFYLKNMGIRNPAMRLMGAIFYSQARRLAHNKIMATLTKATG